VEAAVWTELWLVVAEAAPQAWLAAQWSVARTAPTIRWEASEAALASTVPEVAEA
jgi:hypothetical protein